MSRARTIKPEWLQDELLSQTPDSARIMSIALILLADDYGNGRINKLQQATQVFPPRDESPEEVATSYRRFSEALTKLSEIRFVELYQVTGQHYYSIRNWTKHQKVDHPGKPSVPGPEERDNNPRESLAKDSRVSPETLAKDSRLIGSDLNGSDLKGMEGIAHDARPEPPPAPKALPTRRERASGDLMACPIQELASKCKADPFAASNTPVQERPEVVAVNAAWCKAVGMTLRRLNGYSDRNHALQSILEALEVASLGDVLRACDQASRDDWCRGIKGTDRDPARKRDVGCLSRKVFDRLIIDADAADSKRAKQQANAAKVAAAEAAERRREQEARAAPRAAPTPREIQALVSGIAKPLDSVRTEPHPPRPLRPMTAEQIDAALHEAT